MNEEDFITLTREEVAIRQLNSAIKMYANEDDAVATHTVAAAAFGLLEDIAFSQSRDTFLSYLPGIVRADKVRYIREVIKKPQNFFKHGRTGKGKIRYNPETVNFILLGACYNARVLNLHKTAEIIVFEGMTHLMHPDLFLDGPYKNELLTVRSKIKNPDRKFTKGAIKQVLDNSDKYLKL